MLAVAHTTPWDPAKCQLLASMGVSVFEIDVRVRSGRLVASHFVPLLRHRDVVQRHNWRVRINGPWINDAELSTVVESVPHGCRILLDCKDDAGTSAQPLVAAISEKVTDRARYVLASKNWSSLESLAAAGFETWASIATQRALKASLHEDVVSATMTVRHSLLTPRAVASLKNVRKRVVAWTVNDVRRATALMAIGVDGITSDSAEVLTAAARRR